MTRRVPCAALAALTFLLAVPLTAQEAPPDAWTFTADLGYVLAGGNTELQSLSFGDKVTYDPAGRWRLGQSANWVYSETEGQSTANLITGELRADYDLTPRLSAYGTGGFYRNAFAGISRRFSEGLGLGYKAWAAPRDTLVLEAGGVVFQERLTSGVTDDYSTARAAGSYKHLLSEKAWVGVCAQFLPNTSDFGDYLLDATAELAAPLSASLALRVGFTVHYQSEPAPGFEKTDTIFTSGIQLTL